MHFCIFLPDFYHRFFTLSVRSNLGIYYAFNTTSLTQKGIEFDPFEKRII